MVTRRSAQGAPSRREDETWENEEANGYDARLSVGQDPDNLMHLDLGEQGILGHISKSIAAEELPVATAAMCLDSWPGKRADSRCCRSVLCLLMVSTPGPAGGIVLNVQKIVPP